MEEDIVGSDGLLVFRWVVVFSAYPRKRPDVNLVCRVASVSKKLSRFFSLVSHMIFRPSVDSVIAVDCPFSSVCLKVNLTCFLAVISKSGRLLFSKSSALIS